MSDTIDGLTFDFEAEVWEWTGKGAWSFVTLPQELARDIRHFSGPRRGFGSLRVEAILGSSCWKTSIFPDSKRNSFLLPLKAAVRKTERIETGNTVRVSLRLIDL